MQVINDVKVFAWKAPDRAAYMSLPAQISDSARVAPPSRFALYVTAVIVFGRVTTFCARAPSFQPRLARLLRQASDGAWVTQGMKACRNAKPRFRSNSR